MVFPREAAGFFYGVKARVGRCTEGVRGRDGLSWAGWGATAAGVDDFLAKPVDTNELGMRLPVAERIIGLSAQVRQREAFLPVCSEGKKSATAANRGGTSQRSSGGGRARSSAPGFGLTVMRGRWRRSGGRWESIRRCPKGWTAGCGRRGWHRRVRSRARGAGATCARSESGLDGRHDFARFSPVAVRRGRCPAGLRAGSDELSGGAAVDRDAAAERVAAHGQ